MRALFFGSGKRASNASFSSQSGPAFSKGLSRKITVFFLMNSVAKRPKPLPGDGLILKSLALFWTIIPESAGHYK